MKLSDFIVGKIEFDDFSQVAECDDFKSDLYSLKEDMLQIAYERNCLLDVGWYPSFDPAGCFQVRVIRGGDWDSPIYIDSALSIHEVIGVIEKAQNIILEL